MECTHFSKQLYYVICALRYIDESLKSLATPLNFFIHNLAQFKFSSSSNSQAILSFCPQTYSIATDGKITSATITDYHKRFCPETHYVSYAMHVKGLF